MLKSWLMKASNKAAEKEQDTYLNLLRVGTDSEMAMMLATAAIARIGLKKTSLVSKPFPENHFLGIEPVDSEAAAALSMYNMELIAVRNRTAKSNNPENQFIASGLGVYIATFRSLARPELFAVGRLIWRELLRGEEGYIEAMAHMQPNISQSRAIELFPAPNMLAPNEA